MPVREVAACGFHKTFESSGVPVQAFCPRQRVAKTPGTANYKAYRLNTQSLNAGRSIGCKDYDDDDFA
jgi:hypothetical protein